MICKKAAPGGSVDDPVAKMLAVASHLASFRTMSDKTGPMENLLRDAGVRITRQRKIILRILADHDDHPDAQAIYRRAVLSDKTISLSTVYRTMSLLEERGAIQRHSFQGGRARFEHAPGDHHDHLIDVETGQVIEFISERIEALQEEVARRLGYEIVDHRLEIYGRRIRKPNENQQP